MFYIRNGAHEYHTRTHLWRAIFDFGTICSLHACTHFFFFLVFEKRGRTNARAGCTNSLLCALVGGACQKVRGSHSSTTRLIFAETKTLAHTHTHTHRYIHTCVRRGGGVWWCSSKSIIRLLSQTNAHDLWFSIGAFVCVLFGQIIAHHTHTRTHADTQRVNDRCVMCTHAINLYTCEADNQPTKKRFVSPRACPSSSF